jgi:hypothetical protein
MKTFLLVCLTLLLSALATAAPNAHAQRQDRPDGSVVYVVQAGDTVDGIAFAFGVSRAEIMALNNITDPRLIQIGQELLIRLPSAPSTPPEPTAALPALDSLLATPADQAATAPALTPGIAPAPILAPVQPALDPRAAGVRICLELFDDPNQNRIQDTNELPIAGGTLSLLAPDGAQIAAWDSDADAAARCLDDLVPGGYTASALPPDGFGLTGADALRIDASPGADIRIAFGAARGLPVTPLPAVNLAPVVDEPLPSTLRAAAPPTVTSLIRDNLGLFAFALAGIVLLGGIGMAFLARGKR